MKKIRIFLLKALAKIYGVTLEKHSGISVSRFILIGTHKEINFTEAFSDILKTKHKVYHLSHVIVNFKSNHKNENKLIKIDRHCSTFHTFSIYGLVGTTLTVHFCEDELNNLMGEVPQKISYNVNFIKQK